MRADLLIRNGTIIDGTGAPPVNGNISIVNGRIDAIGDFSGMEQVPILDVEGLVVAPGFVDIHSHSDFTLLVDPRAVSSISQGVTFELVGNCGHGCAPIRNPELVTPNIYGYLAGYELPWRTTAEYLARLDETKPAINVATLIPNGNLRLAVAGNVSRPSSQEEIHEMKSLLSQGMEEGALGYSTGLEYTCEQGCSSEEIVELCRVAKRKGGFYATHTRNRPGEARETIQEAIQTAAAAGISLQISHIASVARLRKESTQAVTEAIEMAEQARAQGENVSFDQHTRNFGTTNLSTILPPWALEGDHQAIAVRLKDKAVRDRMRAHHSIITSLAADDWNRIVVYRSKALPQYSTKSVAEISASMGLDPFDAMCELLLAEINDLHGVMVIAFAYQESDLHLPFQSPCCSVGSDATALAPDGPLAEATMHGAYTWAGWFYRHFVRDKRQMTAQEAIRRMTSLPAEKIGLRRRGSIMTGNWADLAIFNPSLFEERGTTFAPNQPAAGMIHVLVNGQFAMRDGKLLTERFGRVIRNREN